MARNGTDVGIQLAGMPGRWFTAPGGARRGRAAPRGSLARGRRAGHRRLGGDRVHRARRHGARPRRRRSRPSSAATRRPRRARTELMAQICAARSTRFTITGRDYVGTPVGIDARLVVELGVTPQITTGVLHARDGHGPDRRRRRPPAARAVPRRARGARRGAGGAPLQSAPPSARALWAGPGAARALAAAGRGTVEIALPPGGYVRLGGDRWLLRRAAARAARAAALLVGGLERAAHAGRARASTARGRRARRSARCGSTWARGAAAARGIGSRTPPPPALRPGWHDALAARSTAPAPPEELADGLAALRRGALDEAVERAGRARRGPHAGRRRRARRLRGLAPRATGRRRRSWPSGGQVSPIGLAYLRLRRARRAARSVAARALRAVRAGDAARSPRLRARALSRWGASSGAAILWGMAAAGACS